MAFSLSGVEKNPNQVHKPTIFPYLLTPPNSSLIRKQLSRQFGPSLRSAYVSIALICPRDNLHPLMLCKSRIYAKRSPTSRIMGQQPCNNTGGAWSAATNVRRDRGPIGRAFRAERQFFINTRRGSALKLAFEDRKGKRNCKDLRIPVRSI